MADSGFLDLVRDVRGEPAERHELHLLRLHLDAREVLDEDHDALVVLLPTGTKRAAVTFCVMIVRIGSKPASGFSRQRASRAARPGL